MKNVQFNYLYRDGDNYKNYGAVIFSNPSGAPASYFEQLIKVCLDKGLFFIASQIGIPEKFLWNENAQYDPENPPAGLAPGEYVINESDHCWHEFVCFADVDEEPTDERGRSIGQFICEMQNASREGWKEFQPKDRRTK